ncbi:MAG: glycoside hydrolase family 3 C-terminal domain-containing protein [Clostridia bacterium]|nr:glycoside hydrolase family 3 C-terminal domain-containing protein [Clostridia bacterium]
MQKTAEIILNKLTLDEKLAQLVAHGSSADFVKDKHFNSELARKKYPYSVFGFMIPFDLEPMELGVWVSEMLEHFKDAKVPPIVMCESLHGILGTGTTVFPQSIGMGSSFDSDLVYRVGEAIGKEARALGIRMSLAPDLDLGREPRWGRLEETYGEDSYLVGMMGESYVKGLIGKDKKYAATIKHFAAHGSPKSGINLASVTVTEQELFDRYLPPFKKALDAGAYCVMPAYSSLNGVPCHSSTHLLNDILRDNLGFEGVVFSDFGAPEMLTYFQCVAENKADATRLCVKCGLDVEAPSAWAYDGTLKSLIENGEIDIKEIDKMVLRVLKLKEKLGAFDVEKPSLTEIEKIVNCKEHILLAREAAEKSITLLKNDGVLPIKSGSKIAVIGPNAFSVQLGDYALPKLGAKTPYEAIKERAEAYGGIVTAANGCEVYGTDISGFDEAEKLAQDADTVICIIGGKSMKGYGVGWGSEDEAVLTCGEGCDMHDLTPGGMQLDLVRKMIKTGKKVVVIMVDGRPETLHEVTKECNAIVSAWYPGEQGSVALASLLFGDVNFTAKTPVTFPKHTGQLPLCYDSSLCEYGFYHSPGNINNPGRDYVFCDTQPEFPFGYGLNYSELVYKSLSVSYENDKLSVSVEIENKGDYTAEEKVLTFIRDEIASFPQPIKKLVSVEKTVISPRDKKSLTISIPSEALMFTGIDMKKKLEQGWFTIYCGNLSTRIHIK